MQFLLSVVHRGDDAWNPPAEEMDRARHEVGAFNQATMDAGAFVYANGLTPNKNAKTLDYTDGDVTVADGPYSDDVFQVGGFWVLEVEDEATALDWARKASTATRGRVELRPFQTM